MSETSDTPAPPSDRELVTLFLRGRAIKCPVCDYALTDLADGTCPECGLKLELRLALTKPKQGVYVAGLIGLGAGVGFNGLLLGYLVLMRILNGSMFGPPWSYFIPLGVGFVLTTPTLILWARSWKSVQSQSRLVGVTLAASCWALTVGLAVWFFAWTD